MLVVEFCLRRFAPELLKALSRVQKWLYLRTSGHFSAAAHHGSLSFLCFSLRRFFPSSLRFDGVLIGVVVLEAPGL